jgi:hypothetical protein
MLTKDHALSIAKKLKAQKQTAKKNRPHDLYLVQHNGAIVGYIGIRRGSKKGSGHDHIPKDLNTSPHDCLLLAQCPMSLDEWIQQMIQKGLI